MTRGTPEILPFCPLCGKYKGVGLCQNPDCRELTIGEGKTSHNRSKTCVICSSEGVSSCSICNRMYCSKHSIGKNETHLISIKQYIGTCKVCNEFVCEQCWIFNKDGNIMCLKHIESRIQ